MTTTITKIYLFLIMLQRPNEIKVSVGYRVNGSWKETQQISTGRF